jgi:hypothetical protein
MARYGSLLNEILGKRMVSKLNSGEMQRFEVDNPVTDEQKRLLTCSAVLFTQNIESCRTFRIKAEKNKVFEMLASGWGIYNQEEALAITKDLSVAKRHTLFADDVYKTIVQKGFFAPLYPDDLHDITGLENAYQSVVDLSELAMRINDGIKSYQVARKMLIDLGYSENELLWVKSTAAWDYGRAGFIARYSAKTGFMKECDAWDLMRVAADNAVKVYHDWREYLAGYVFGRALAYCSDSTDIYPALRYLLNHNNSPFNEVSL